MQKVKNYVKGMNTIEIHTLFYENGVYLRWILMIKWRYKYFIYEKI